MARLTKRVSFGSRVLSPITVTVSFFVDTPIGKLMVPLIGRKSTPDVAVPEAVE